MRSEIELKAKWCRFPRATLEQTQKQETLLNNYKEVQRPTLKVSMKIYTD